MRCFNHSTTEAVGVCLNCGRAVCHECVSLVEDAVACKNRCEEKVASIKRMIRNNPAGLTTIANQYRQSGRYALWAGILFGVMGCLFFVFAPNEFGKYLGGTFVVLGILVFLNGLGTLRTSQKYSQFAHDNSGQLGDS